MSDPAMTDDEREYMRLLWAFEDIANAFNYGRADLLALKAAESDVLDHYRKAKADAFERGRYYTPPPVDPGSDPGAHHA